MKTLERNNHKYFLIKYKGKSWNGIPAFMKYSHLEISLYNQFFMSTVWHIVFFLLLWLLVFVLKISGIAPMELFKQKPKMQDIHFVLNNPHHYYHKPRVIVSNLNTPSNDFGMQKKQSINQSSSGHGNELQNNTAPVKKADKKSRNSVSKSSAPDAFSIPVAKIKPLSGGFGSLGKNGDSKYGSTSGSSSGSSGAGSGVGNGSGVGSGSGRGSGFDKNSVRKTIASYDISPYVNELKREIRWNWKIPQNAGNKRVELFLRIAKDGRVTILNVKRTSEVGEIDNAALNAVRKAQPLNPLPAKYTKGYLDVVFTFNSGSSSLGSRY